MNLNLAIDKFIDFYGPGERRVFFSPGRINLIGEHLDYNGGHVLPAAIDKGIYFIARKREDSKVSLCSVNMGDKKPIVFDTFHDINEKNASWLIYPKGVKDFLVDNGVEINQGFDLLLWASLPNSAGVSSSAALLVGFMYMFDKLYDLGFTKIEYALFAQKVENDYIGLNCGIMDQFAVAFGKKDTAIFLNTNDLTYDYIPANLGNYSIVVIDSNKKRELRESDYNNRRNECESALGDIRTKYEVEYLADFDVDRLNEIDFRSKVYEKRATYVIEEEARTIDSCRYLSENNIELFANELNKSHIGLRDLYEVTGKELDTLFDLALKHGAIGSRMTGAGFGGCTISLVEKNIVDKFIENVTAEYKALIGLEAKAFVVGIGDGTKEMEL